LSASFQVSADALRNRVPGLSVENNPATHAPEIVYARSNGPIFLTAPATENHETIVRRFLRENSSLYGLTPAQIEQLKLTADYTNPSGNLSWVEFQQEINGIPVFQGYLRGALTPAGALTRTTSNLAAGLQYSQLPTTPVISAAEAVA